MPDDATRGGPTPGVGFERPRMTYGAQRWTLAADPPLTGDAAFHCQQAAEKALKAFLTWHDIPFRKTHDLAEIGQQCVRLDVSLEPVCRRAERLTVFAWIFRYPGDVQDPPVEKVVDALALAREVYDGVLTRVPARAWP